MTAEPLPLATLGPPRCADCQRILVSRALWTKYSDTQRKSLHPTHARYLAENLCCTCHRKAHPTPVREPDPDQYAWPAEAWRRGRNGILYPTGPRPVDKDSPNPQYRRDTQPPASPNCGPP